MKQSPIYSKLIECLEKGILISHAQQNYLFKILNNGTPEQKQQIAEIFSENEEGFILSDDNVEQGKTWLLNLWKTPSGTERKNNPYGYREQEALTNFDTIRLASYYDAGNYNFSYQIPVYDVYATDGSGFQYIVKGGQISIIG